MVILLLVNTVKIFFTKILYHIPFLHYHTPNYIINQQKHRSNQYRLQEPVHTAVIYNCLDIIRNQIFLHMQLRILKNLIIKPKKNLTEPARNHHPNRNSNRSTLNQCCN